MQLKSLFAGSGVFARASLALAAAAALGTSSLAATTAPVAAATASQAGPATFRRLSEDQYKRSIAQIFGTEIAVPGRFEPPVREEGLLAIGQSHVVVTPAGFEQYALRAREIAAAVLDDTRRAKYIACTPQARSPYDEVCARQFYTSYGRQLLRRPLKPGELASLLKLTRDTAGVSGSFVTGLRSGLAQLLVSPAFVFRMESVEPDPAKAGEYRLDAWSLASRISFLLWDAPPDTELLDAAASGALNTPAGVNAQVDRLMASPRLEQGLRAFFSDMLAYDQFNGLSKDAKLFPIFNAQLRDDAQEQSLKTLVDHLLVRNGDYRDIFTTKKTFLTRSLGALYGIPVDARAFGGWMPYTFPQDVPVAGLLTFPAFAMLDPSHEGRSSPTNRGKMVRENLLCQKVPAPPANVNFNIVQDVNDPVRRTARERLTAHQDNPVCAGCHKITDPIGLALENYTPVGVYRAQENGVTIDASGEIDGQEYSNALELSLILRNGTTAPSCVAQRMVEYGIGRVLSAGEELWLEAIDERFGSTGYKFRALLRDVATGAQFRAAAAPTAK